MNYFTYAIKSNYFLAAICTAFCVNLCSFAVQDDSYNADQAYGVVQAHPVLDSDGNPSGDTIKTTQLETSGGVLSVFMSSLEGAPLYSDYACTDKIGSAKFLEEFYEVWRSNDIALLANSNTPNFDAQDPSSGHATKIAGYIKRSDFIHTKSGDHGIHCMRTSANIAQKALSVQRWGDDKTSDRAQILNAPVDSASVLDEINLYEINYIYAVHGVGTEDNDGYYLVGRTPYVIRGTGEVNNIRGWVAETLIFNWDHRQCIEINKAPDALQWRTENQKYASFYGSVEEAASQQNALYQEDTGKEEPWAYNVPRFPIIFDKKTQEEQLDDRFLKVGVIGDSYSGDRTLDSSMEADLQGKLEEMQEEISTVDILLVIDATGSMSEFYGSIGRSIGEIQAGFDKANLNARYAVSYYRDYTEELDENSWSHYYRDFLPSEQFRSLFDASSSEFIPSAGGSMDPCPFAGIIQGVNSVSWEPQSSKIVILIGDQGNTRAQTTGAINYEGTAADSDADIRPLLEIDSRGNTLDLVKKTLDQFNISMFCAIQTNPEAAANPSFFDNTDPLINKYLHWRYKEFNSQVRQIQLYLGVDKLIDVINGSSGDLTEEIFMAADTYNIKIKLLNTILQGVKEGKPLPEAVHKTLKDDFEMEYKEGKRSAAYDGDAWGVFITDEAISRAENKGIDVDLMLNERIQNFAFSYIAKRDGSPHPPILTKILMTKGEVEHLLSALSLLERQSMTPANVDKIWRSIINAAIGELEDAFTFDETKPLSEYFSKSLGIPTRSEYLSQSVRSLKTLEPTEIASWNAEIKEKVQQLRNFITDKKIDGTGTEKHVFTKNGFDYAYVPIELFP